MSTYEKPTRVRYSIVASASLMAVLLYLDRFCISFAEVFIQEDLGLTNNQTGWMLSAFFWTYALGQVPSGWLTDRFGSRLMLTLYVLLWSLFTGLTGAAFSLVALLALRLGFGLAQAGAYPTASSIVSKWVPFARRGTASGIVAFGGRMGGFLAVFVSGYLLVLLTPLDTRTTLVPDDFLDGPLVCYQLRVAADEPSAVLRRRCLEEFTEEGRSTVDRNGRIYADRLAAERESLRSEGEDPDSAVVKVLPLSDEDLQTLSDNLNAIIGNRGFFTLDDVTQKDIPVEKEVERLLGRADNLSDSQVQRINRLVLESLCRDDESRGLKQLYRAGWRPMMFLYGSLGILIAALVWRNCRTTPSEHPNCNDAEAVLITGSQPSVPATHVTGVPWRELLTSRSMWCSCITQWFTNIGWIFLLTWAPRYYDDVHHLATEKRALLVAIPPMIGWVGMLAGGPLSDFAARRLGLRWGRALPISLSRFLAMAAYIGCLTQPSVYGCVFLFSVVAFSADLGNPSGWAFTQDVGGRHVGSVLGWGNMWGNLGAAVTPPLLIWVVGETAVWNNAFMVCAGAFFLSGLSALGIDASVPIVPTEDDVQTTK